MWDICFVARVDFFLPLRYLWVPPAQKSLLTGSSLMCINDQRIQASLWTKQIIAAVRTSSKTAVSLCSRPR